MRVDGNDVLAVYRVCKEAVERARNGDGPTLVETVTYRMASHSSSDDAARYRDADEFEQWKQRDPIERFQRYLEAKGLWNGEQAEAWATEIKEELNAAIKRSEAKPKPDPESLFEDVYMNPTPQLRDQRDELLALEGPEADDVGEFPL